MNEFYNVDYAEQETIVNFFYCESIASLYTSKKSIYNRLKNRLGEADQKYYTDNKISGARWNILFSDSKRIKYILSKPILIGRIK